MLFGSLAALSAAPGLHLHGRSRVPLTPAPRVSHTHLRSPLSSSLTLLVLQLIFALVHQHFHRLRACLILLLGSLRVFAELRFNCPADRAQ
jgi:hypothetical protein